MTTLAELLGLDEEAQARLQAEIKTAFDAIAESERQAAIHSHEVFIR